MSQSQLKLRKISVPSVQGSWERIDGGRAQHKHFKTHSSLQKQELGSWNQVPIWFQSLVSSMHPSLFIFEILINYSCVCASLGKSYLILKNKHILKKTLPCLVGKLRQHTFTKNTAHTNTVQSMYLYTGIDHSQICLMWLWKILNIKLISEKLGHFK